MENSHVIRLSEAYPPKSENNKEYLANVHSILKDCDIEKTDFKNITIRKIKNRNEMEQIQLLHKEWFPINYTNDYFESVFKGKYNGLVAEIKLVKNNRLSETVVVGCILYNIRNASQKYLDFSYCDYFKNFKSIYIMTIGVINELRKHGIATLLLNKVIDIHINELSIKYIYLHVVEYNHSAQKFYVKNNFELFKLKRKHYFIEENYYDAFVYIYFINNGKKPKSYQEKFKSVIQYPIQLLGNLKNCASFFYRKIRYNSL